MKDGDKKFRFLLVQAFSLPESSAYQLRRFRGPKEDRLMNCLEVAPLLADVEWHRPRLLGRVLAATVSAGTARRDRLGGAGA